MDVINKTPDFLRSKNVKLFSQIQGNSVNDCDVLLKFIVLPGAASAVTGPGCHKTLLRRTSGNEISIAC